MYHYFRFAFAYRCFSFFYSQGYKISPLAYGNCSNRNVRKRD